ncbi:hypothetical protein ACFLUS_03715 [Chloroflexota bacterium]
MSEVFNEAQEILQCKSCPWYKNCVMPMRVTEEDLRRQMEGMSNSNTISGLPSQASEFLSTMAAAAQNSLLEGCPVFIRRLQNDPELARRIKQMIQSGSYEREQ